MASSDNNNGLKFDRDEIIKVLKWFAERKKNFQVDLARAAKIDKTFVSNFKNGKVKTLTSPNTRLLYETLNNPSLVIIDLNAQTARLRETPEKERKKMNVNHCMYIIAKNDNEDDWEKLIRFADTVEQKKLFILKPTDYEISDDSP
jgi:hypothetical protein